MAAGEAADESTFGGRLRAARLGSPYSAKEIAKKFGRATEQTIYDWEKGRTAKGKIASPKPEEVPALARLLGRSTDWLLSGAPEYDATAPVSELVATLTVLEDDLTRGQRDQLIVLAGEMAKQTRERRASGGALSAREEVLVRLFRAAPPEEQEEILLAAGASPSSASEEEESAQAGAG